MKYDVNYFIEKFEAIPEKRIIVDSQDEGENHCALGWCNPDYVKAKYAEYSAIQYLFKCFKSFTYPEDVTGGWAVADINNGYNPLYQQPTPKQRILAALYDIRDKELSEANVMAVNKIVNENSCVDSESSGNSTAVYHDLTLA